MFEFKKVDTKNDQQLKLSLTVEETDVIAEQTLRHKLASRQDFVKFCIAYFLEAQHREDMVEDVDLSDRDQIDNTLVQFLIDNPESRRREIEAGLQQYGIDSWDIDKSMKRCKNNGRIARNGETGSARWYATD